MSSGTSESEAAIKCLTEMKKDRQEQGKENEENRLRLGLLMSEEDHGRICL